MNRRGFFSSFSASLGGLIAASPDVPATTVTDAGKQVFYYEAGNPQSLQEVRAALKHQGVTNAIVMPRVPVRVIHSDR